MKDKDVERWFLGSQYDPRRAATMAIDELKKRAGEGDIEADLQLDEWTLGGARQALKRAFASLHRMRATSERIPLPARMSVQTDDGSRQLVAWDDMTHPQFDQMVAGYRHQTISRQRKLTLFVATQRVWDQQPHIATASEAFAAAGISVADEIDVEDIA